MAKTITETKKLIYEIESYGKKYQVTPKLGLYTVYDWEDEERYGLGICLDLVEDGEIIEPFATLTVSFGEFLGIKNAAFIDTNNCDFANQLLEQGFGTQTQYVKQSGFCTYPLWVFEESLLKQIDSKTYEKYEKQYKFY